MHPNHYLPQSFPVSLPYEEIRQKLINRDIRESSKKQLSTTVFPAKTNQITAYPVSSQNTPQFAKNALFPKERSNRKSQPWEIPKIVPSDRPYYLGKRPSSPNVSSLPAENIMAQKINRFDKQKMFLLQRLGPHSFKVGSTLKTKTGSRTIKFKVNIGPQTCSCGRQFCPHLLFIMIKVFVLHKKNPLVWRENLKNYEVEKLFHEYEKNESKPTSPQKSDCPICLSEIQEHKASSCQTGCYQKFHSECVDIWAEHCKTEKSSLKCPLCRKVWKEFTFSGEQKECTRIEARDQKYLEFYSDEIISIIFINPSEAYEMFVYQTVELLMYCDGEEKYTITQYFLEILSRVIDEIEETKFFAKVLKGLQFVLPNMNSSHVEARFGLVCDVLFKKCAKLPRINERTSLYQIAESSLLEFLNEEKKEFSMEFLSTSYIIAQVQNLNQTPEIAVGKLNFVQTLLRECCHDLTLQNLLDITEFGIRCVEYGNIRITHHTRTMFLMMGRYATKNYKTYHEIQSLLRKSSSLEILAISKKLEQYQVKPTVPKKPRKINQHSPVVDNPTPPERKLLSNISKSPCHKKILLRGRHDRFENPTTGIHHSRSRSQPAEMKNELLDIKTHRLPSVDNALDISQETTLGHQVIPLSEILNKEKFDSENLCNSCQKKIEKEENEHFSHVLAVSREQDCLPEIPNLNYCSNEPELIKDQTSLAAKSQYIKGRDWNEGKVLGSGNSGTCRLARDNLTGTLMAVKIIKMDQTIEKDENSTVVMSSGDSSKEKIEQSVVNEIDILKNLVHPNLVRLHGATKEVENGIDKIYIFTEWCAGGSVQDLLKSYGAFQENVIITYVTQIIRGLSHLHSNKIIHRDIKGANLLVDSTGQRLRITDFGAVARLKYDETLKNEFGKEIIGTLAFIAPEILRNEQFGRASDIWSMGITILQMATGTIPYDAENENYKQNIWSLFYKIATSRTAPEIPTFLSQALQDFIKRLLQLDPKDRPLSTDLHKHPVFIKW